MCASGDGGAGVVHEEEGPLLGQDVVADLH